MSLKIAMTGLKAASADLAATSNNIANASTVGFKKSSVNFADVFSAGGTGNKLAMGVKIVDTAQHFSQGNVTSTDNQMDLSIIGEGFFRMNTNGTTTYTRAGSFGVDSEGYVVNGSGHKLTGFPGDKAGVLYSEIADLRIDATDSAPNATTAIELNMNLDSSTEVPVVAEFNVDDPSTYSHASSTAIFDSLGGSHLATLYYSKQQPNEWRIHTVIGDQQVSPPDGDIIQFTPGGTLLSVNDSPVGKLTTAAFTPAPGTAEMQLEIDVQKITQYESQSGVNELSQDGYPAGRLSGIEIDDQGFIYGRYTNEQLAVRGQIAVTKFRNPQGLAPADETSWFETFASGEAIVGEPGSGSLGLIQSGALEDSNVDITEELVKIIGTQRNYQANAQVISVSDTMTQTVMNIRR